MTEGTRTEPTTVTSSKTYPLFKRWFLDPTSTRDPNAPRGISVWQTSSSGARWPWTRRSTTSSQSPTVMMAIIGCLKLEKPCDSRWVSFLEGYSWGCCWEPLGLLWGTSLEQWFPCKWLLQWAVPNCIRHPAGQNPFSWLPNVGQRKPSQWEL